MLTERQQKLLQAIIHEHIHSAEPIGSASIVKLPDFRVSSATIRNEMLELEQAGYLYQPYTSAGRIPTEKAWKQYLETVAKPVAVAKGSEKQLGAALRRGDTPERGIKELAKELAEISQQTVIFSFAPNDNFYTGISHLLRQPEFADRALVNEISELIDHLDTVVGELYDEINKDIKTYIGRDNPFGVRCGFIAVKSKHGLLGLLGPMRQDYPHNQALISYSYQLLDTHRV